MNERRQDSGEEAQRSTERVERWLRSARRGPALVIAAGEARLIAANPAGAHLLGLGAPPERPVPLDSAMPAIMDLRRTVNRGAHGRGPLTPLVFWTSDGIARLHCHVEIINDDSGAPIVLVEVATDTAAAARVDAEDTKRDAAASDNNEPPDAPASSRRIETANRHASGSDGASAEPALGSDPRKAQEPLGGTPRAHHEAHRNMPNAGASAGLVPPAPPPTSAPPARSDEDTLKAIARQILAGRRAAPKTAGHDVKAPAVGPARPNGAVPHPDDAAAGPGPTSKPASRTTPAAGARSATESMSTPTAGTLPNTTSIPALSRTAPYNVRHSEAGARRAASKRNEGTPDPRQPAAPSSPPKASRPQTKVTQAPIGACAASDKPTRKSTFPAKTSGAEVGRAPARNEVTQPGDSDRSSTTLRKRVRRMAHELKTPISAIASAAEIMKDERLGSIGDERYLRYAQDIFESARHALVVIERMLGQSPKETESSELAFTNLDLNALAERLLSGLEAMADDAGLTLVRDLAPRLPLIVADATSVRQIVLNLLTNALKFTPRGGNVRLATQLQQSGELTLSVIDTGPGMSETEMARNMGSGAATETEDNRQQRPGGGLGIGLPLARALAAANGAALEISVHADGGTQVTLAFPVSRQVPI